jgi:hypothetical protein
MLIQSSFSDYYDGVASSGIDTTVRYHRETSTIKAVSPFYIDHLPTNLYGRHFEFVSGRYHRALFEASLKAPSCHFSVIGYCGIHIVIAEINKSYYFGEQILDADWSNQKRHRQPTVRQVVADLIQKFNGKSDNKLFQQFQVPLFIIPMYPYMNAYAYEMRHPGLYQATFTLNPNLNELQFYKYKDAYSAFQEIQSYISGVLGVDAKPTIELSDKSKIIKAGFDPKTSFRKGKEPRK